MNTRKERKRSLYEETSQQLYKAGKLILEDKFTSYYGDLLRRSIRVWVDYYFRWGFLLSRGNFETCSCFFIVNAVGHNVFIIDKLTLCMSQVGLSCTLIRYNVWDVYVRYSNGWGRYHLASSQKIGGIFFFITYYNLNIISRYKL